MLKRKTTVKYEREMGHYVYIAFGSTNFMLRKHMSAIGRHWSSTLQAEPIRTSLQRLEIGILSVSARESCVSWDLPKLRSR